MIFVSLLLLIHTFNCFPVIELQKESSSAEHENTSVTTATSTRQLKNVLVCGVSRSKPTDAYVPNKPCHTDYYSFSFMAYFHKKDLLKTSSLKSIAQSLRENLVCDIKYMRPGVTFYWYEGKQLNTTQIPDVYILKENDDRKKIVIKCPLRQPDVALSLNGVDPKAYHSAQSHPLVSNKVTVSAFHVKLTLKGIDMDKPMQQQADSFFDFSSRSFIMKTLFRNQRTALPERFLVFYDSKCRRCEANATQETFDPINPQSILCSLKEKSCESEGVCYDDREISTPLELDHKPNVNMFVCNANVSQTNLYMPCAFDNGNCPNGQSCHFNSTSFQVKCS